MTPQTRFIRKTDVIVAPMGEETVMMDGDAYFGLNPVAAHIWALLEEARSLEEIQESVARGFDAPDRAALEADVRGFVDLLEERSLIAPS